jgi:hypothetical protein
MNLDVEDLLRSGMERFTDEVQAPRGLAKRAARARSRRRLTAVAAGAGAAAVVTVAAVIAATGAASVAPPAPAPAQARAAAYVIKRVENALAGEHLVFRGLTTSTSGPSVTWAYGARSRFEEFTGSGCGHVLPNGGCTYRGGSERYLAQGTALIGGNLHGAYVTYFDHKYSLSAGTSRPLSACSTTGRLEMGGPPIVTHHWSDFINTALACGAATVTGHVRINGVETTKITGSPVMVKLSPGYGKVVREKQARVQWTLYVNPKTYLPVRMYGSTSTFGGPAGSTRFTSVTDVQWLRPTAANIAQTLVTIPAGFHRVSSAADQ